MAENAKLIIPRRRTIQSFKDGLLSGITHEESKEQGPQSQ